MQFSRSTQKVILNLAREEQGSLMAGEVIRIPEHGNLFLAHGDTPPSDDFSEFARVSLDGVEHYVCKKIKGPVGVD